MNSKLMFNNQERVDAKVKISGLEVAWGYKTKGMTKYEEFATGETIPFVMNRDTICKLRLRVRRNDGNGYWDLIDIPIEKHREGNRYHPNSNMLVAEIPEKIMASDVASAITKFLMKLSHCGDVANNVFYAHRNQQLDWMNLLATPIVSEVSHLNLTPFGIKYAQNCVHHLEWVPNRDDILQGRLAHVSGNTPAELTKMTNLRNGIVNTLPIVYFNNMKKGKLKDMKYLKLITGSMKADSVDKDGNTIPVLPEELLHPKKVKIMNLPKGVCIVSKKLAKLCKIMGRDGKFRPLRTGDKLSGVIDTKEFGPRLLKATVVVYPIQPYSIIIGEDCDKGLVEFNDDTMVHVSSIAEERVSTDVSLSYQVTQYWPELAMKLGLAELSRVRRLEGSHFINDEGKDDFGYSPSLRDMLEGRGSILSYADLFRYPLKNSDGDIYEYDSIGKAILANGSIEGYEEEIKAKLMLALDQAFNPRVHGAWLVAVPDRLGVQSSKVCNLRPSISIPRSAWLKLRKPKVIAVTRYPFKGRKSLVKLMVRVHDDADGFVAKLPTDIMELVFNGDCDGDLVCIITDRSIVRLACDPILAVAMAKAAKGLYKPYKDLVAPGISYHEAGKRLIEMDQMGLAVTILDNYWNANSGTKNIDMDILRLFEALVQLAIDRKEGSEIKNVMEQLKEIAIALGIPLECIKDGGKPNSFLQILRGGKKPKLNVEGEEEEQGRDQMTLDEALDIAKQPVSGPHSYIVSILNSIKLGI